LAGEKSRSRRYRRVRRDDQALRLLAGIGDRPTIVELAIVATDLVGRLHERR